MNSTRTAVCDMFFSQLAGAIFEFLFALKGSQYDARLSYKFCLEYFKYLTWVNWNFHKFYSIVYGITVICLKN